MIQLFAKLQDLIPTEGTSVDWVPLEKCWDKDEYNHTSFWDWFDSIKTEGIKHPLKVHPDGHIADGNFRYWCALVLYNQGNRKFKYVPIDFHFFLGMQKESQYFSYRKELLENVPFDFNQKINIIPSNRTFKNLLKSELGHGINLFSGIKIDKLTLLENKSSL